MSTPYSLTESFLVSASETIGGIDTGNLKYKTSSMNSTHMSTTDALAAFFNIQATE